MLFPHSWSILKSNRLNPSPELLSSNSGALGPYYGPARPGKDVGKRPIKGVNSDGKVMWNTIYCQLVDVTRQFCNIETTGRAACCPREPGGQKVSVQEPDVAPVYNIRRSVACMRPPTSQRRHRRQYGSAAPRARYGLAMLCVRK